MKSWKDWLWSWIPSYSRVPQLDPLPPYPESEKDKYYIRPDGRYSLKPEWEIPKQVGRYNLKPDRILLWYYGERVKAGLPKYPDGHPDS